MHSANVLAAAKELLAALLVVPLFCFNFIVSPKLILGTELGSEAAHWAEIQAAYKRQEPFIAYAWEPHWIHAALDLVKVELPEHSDDKWPGTGWAEDVTYNYGNPELASDHPEVVEVIKNFRLTNDMQAPLILAIDVDGKDMEEVVSEWMEANEDVWKAWLPNG